MRVIIAWLVLLLGCLSARAATLSATPDTFAGQLAAMGPGDTLELQAGTYRTVLRGPVPPGLSWDQPTTIRAAPGATVVFAPPDPGPGLPGAVLDVSGTAYVSIEGIAVDASQYQYAASIGGDGGHHIRLVGVELRDARGYRRPGESDWHGGPNLHILGHDNAVLSSRIHGSKHSYGIYVDMGQRHLIADNDIYDNAGYGIQLYSGYADGTPGTGSDGHIVRGNRLWQNGFGRQQPALVVGHGQGTVITENLVTDNWGGIAVSTDAMGVTVQGNTLAGNRHNGVTVDPAAVATVVRDNILTPVAAALPPRHQGSRRPGPTGLRVLVVGP